jgi:DNA-binding MarR family transcriptional regulator
VTTETTKPAADPDAAAIGDTASLLMMVTEWMRRSFGEVAASFDLTPVQARALLGLKSAVPMRSLADHLHCDASNVTGIADRLEAGGLVTRQASRDDRRVKLLALTPKGDSTRTRLEAAMLEASPIMAGLSADERLMLRELLAKIVTRTGERPQHCVPPDA